MEGTWFGTLVSTLLYTATFHTIQWSAPGENDLGFDVGDFKRLVIETSRQY